MYYINRIITALCLIGLLTGTACSSGGGPGSGPFVSATLAVPADMSGGAEAMWSASILGGIAPFTVSWDFGGGAMPNTVTLTGQTAAASTTPTMLTGHWFAVLTVADAAGHTFVTPSPGVEYYVTDGIVNPIELASDTLYALPQLATAAVGEAVRVVVATGIPNNPFQYMTGAGLTMPSDGTYVKGSFNAGAPGGEAGDVDGYWAQMAPAGGFLLAPDSFIVPVDIGNGRVRFDFNLTPLSGSNQFTAKGALFNAQFSFSTAGTKVFRFQQTQGVKRTYYSDDSHEYFWGDIANAHAGIPNSVDVQ